MISSKISARLNLLNITALTAAQSSIIPAIRSGENVLIRDLTGSGKTMGLLLALLSMKKQSTSLFILPTRYLAFQVHNWINTLSPESMPSLAVSGHPFKLNNPSGIIVGTPLKLYELYQEKVFQNVGTIVLDEVDKLIRYDTRYATITRKFKNKTKPMYTELLVNWIVKEKLKESLGDSLKKHGIQFVAASATLDSSCRRHLKLNGWFDDALVLNLSGTAAAPSQLIHSCVVLQNDGTWRDLDPDCLTRKLDSTSEPEEEEEALADDDNAVILQISHLTELLDCQRGMIFSHSSISTHNLVERMNKLMIPTKALKLDFASTNESPSQQAFADNHKLICLDEHSARGLDLPEVSHVFVMGKPSSYSTYLHMCGRSGRMNRPGHCITILSGTKYERKMAAIYALLGLDTSKVL